MVKSKDKWSALSMSERADLIKLYANNGTTNLSSIKSHYNKFGGGGDAGGDVKSNSNPLLGPILKIANVILQSDRVSDTQKDRLLEFAMRISGGNVNSDSVAKASEYVLSKYGRKALLQVLSTDTPVSDIVNQSIQESGYTMGDNYGGVAFSNDFWDNGDFIWNNAESDDFVDAYVKGTTPYESAGVIKISSEDPGRIGRYSRYIKKNYPDRDIPTYQAHRDTLDTDLVKHLDAASTALETSTFGANADEGSYQEAFPFGSEENRGFFDAAGYNIELVKGLDGKIYGRKSDMYDFLPSDFNDKWVENDQVQGLVKNVDRMGHPFIFRTPWFEATEENVPEEILLEYTEQNKKSLGGKLNRFETGGPVNTFDINTPISPTQYWEEFIAENSVPFSIAPDAAIDEKELVRRQAWAESAGNDRAGSHKGAKGRYQIMPNTLSEYQKATGDIGDIYDPVYNRRVRDWEFNRYKNSDQVNRGEPTDSVKMGRRLAIYNYGYGNVRKALNKADSLGADIDNSFEWLQYLPQETQDYVNFILRNKDTGAHRTNSAYKNRKKVK